MPTKSKRYAKRVNLRTTTTRNTIVCNIPVHFNDRLAATGQQLEYYKVSKKTLNLLGVTCKRFYQLMRGKSPFLFSEAAAYAEWQGISISALYNFIQPKK